MSIPTMALAILLCGGGPGMIIGGLTTPFRSLWSNAAWIVGGLVVCALALLILPHMN